MADVVFKNVSFRYGSHAVLEDFNLEIKSGEIFCLVGSSGCGKTTLTRCLLGLNRPSAGEILIGGVCVFSASRHIDMAVERRNIGMVFQDYAVWPHMTVGENVAYPLKKKGITRRETEERVKKALDLVNMGAYSGHLPNQLSGGQQQRVAVARALAAESDVIVMDEPFSNLDAKLREQMLDELRDIQKKSGTTILYITHDQQSALRLCDRMAIMEPGGKLCQTGTDEEIILHPKSRFAFEFIGVANFIPVRKSPDGTFRLIAKEREFDWVPAQDPSEAGERFLVGVRPGDIVFDPDSPLRVTVRRAVFLGGEYDYFADLGGTELRIRQNSQETENGVPVREGTETGIRFCDCRYFPKEEGAAI